MELQGNKLRECDESKTSEQDKATGYHWFKTTQRQQIKGNSSVDSQQE